MKPMLAHDYDESKVVFPCIIQPKIDGVRGLNMTGAFTGRSLKPPKNRWTVSLFSQPDLIGCDGELAAGPDNHPSLCRMTSSAVGTIEGEPAVVWHLFDLVRPDTAHLPYLDRYKMLCEHIAAVKDKNWVLSHRVTIVPMIICEDLARLRRQDELWLAHGYEGTIIRGVRNAHKQGRSTIREGGLLRIKHFVEAEARVLSLIEGNRNDNEAQINELGLTFRTSHQDNMEPNGMIGSMTCEDVATGKHITVSAGCLDAEQRRHYFENPFLILDRKIIYKHFPKGVKDKPRFPTFKDFA